MLNVLLPFLCDSIYSIFVTKLFCAEILKKKLSKQTRDILEYREKIDQLQQELSKVCYDKLSYRPFIVCRITSLRVPSNLFSGLNASDVGVCRTVFASTLTKTNLQDLVAVGRFPKSNLLT